MESGCIVEYIDRQKILCAVVLEVKQKRLRLLTENNREVNLATGRLSHLGKVRLDLSMGRDKMVENLRAIARRRSTLIADIDIQELWEALNSEQEWIDLETMTAFCFPTDPTPDHESAVVRAFFRDRMYFKFNPDRFFPNSEQMVEQIESRNRTEEWKARLTDLGALWLRHLMSGGKSADLQGSDADSRYLREVFKSCYLFGRDSEHMALGRDILKKAGVGSVDRLFAVLVALGEFSEDENIELHRQDVPVAFPETVLQEARALQAPGTELLADPRRRDLTRLAVMTIDGQATLDYDDALSIERSGGQLRLGVHISDVGHLVPKESRIDRTGAERGSSIYAPDQRIPMMPDVLAEGLCSLKADCPRPAVSLMVTVEAGARISHWEIFPSVIRVRDQLSYYDVNLMADNNPDIRDLCAIADGFRKYRLDSGAVQITLPEVHVWVGDDGQITVNRVNRESPGRRLVAEIMILANWLMAKFLAQKGLAAVYRSQPEPRERLYAGEEGTLYQNYMQRRLLNRFVLGTRPDAHSGLGLDVYVTATSPIRKYFDLVTQRQIRAGLGLEAPYSPEEVDRIIQGMAQPMQRVFAIQRTRNRYWLLKHLESRIGGKLEAIVLAKRRTAYQVLLTEYMLECDLPLSGGVTLKPEDMIQVTVQQANARRDSLSVFMG